MSRLFPLVAALVFPAIASALEIKLPLGRVAYQTNENIELAIVRTGSTNLPAGELQLTLKPEQGGKLEFVFALPVVTLEGKAARRTEHIHLNGRLLRPGNYTVEARADGQTTTAKFELYSHIRQSTFKLVDWGSRATGAEQAVLGENGMGFNVLLASYGGLSADDAIRAGMDYMWCCTMSGGHQMDLRLECDWSDPLVLRGGTARVVRRAFQDRVNPNCIGVHFYDEPGLTWHKHPVTGEFTPHGVPAQQRAYAAAFGRNPPDYAKMDPKNAKDIDDWLHWGRWKLGFMEAAWKDAAFGVSRVRSDFLSMNQAVYGWNAYTDGYYFNISRPLPILGGHGGYDDFGALYFNPSWFLEFGRARDLARPNWYLPTWYDGTPPMRYRMEQYLSFMNNIQGMMKPPDMQVHRPSKCAAAEGIVESNKLMAKLGTIFTTMPVSRPPVAVLYSMSQNLRSQAKDRSDNYEGGGQRNKTMFAYLAGKTIHQPLFPIVEEDILDGSLAAHHKAVLLPGTNQLDVRIVRALEQFIANGGQVLLSDDCKVEIKGAVKVGAPIDTTFSDTLAKLWKENKQEEIAKVNTVGNMLKSNEKFATALKAKLESLGIRPMIECDNSGIVVTRHGNEDVEYIFLVNTSYDEEIGDRMSLKGAVAKLSLPAKGKQLYDAISGGHIDSMKLVDGKWSGELRFGPGQMKVFALLAEPPEVKLGRPTVKRDYTMDDSPLSVECAASVHGVTHMLGGSIPLQIKLTDPHGVVRYSLYRATKDGVCPISLPLAANDPPGTWKVQVRELLNNDQQTLVFELTTPQSCGAAAGTVARAISFGNDRENIYRFFRTFKEVTLIKGSSEYHSAAAERLAKALAARSVRVTTMNAAEVKPRELTEEEAKTWIGLQPGKAKAGKDNPPSVVGFNIRGPVVLIGNPQDNPVIAFLEKEKFLPYTPAAGVIPGVGRSYLAWQRDAVGYDQESVTLIAHDAAGMNEAIGTLAEIVAGIQPLMAKEPPLASVVEPGPEKQPVREPEILFEGKLPDRIVGMSMIGPFVSADGTLYFPANGINLTRPWTRVMSVASEQILGPLVGFTGHAALASGTKVMTIELVTGEPVLSPFSVLAARRTTFGILSHSRSAPVLSIVTSDGLLKLIDVSKKQQWTMETRKAAKTPVDPYFACAFDFESNNLYAATATELQLIDIQNGKIIQRIPGADGRYGLQEYQQHLFFSDGKTIRGLSRRTRKIDKELSVPPGGLTLYHSVDSERVMIATNDSVIRLMDYGDDLEKARSYWRHSGPRAVPKLMAHHSGGYAIAYWGGTLELLDKQGKRIASRQYDHDITGLQVIPGDAFAIGFSDGRILVVR